MGEGTRLSMKFLGLRPEQKTSAYYSELATTLGSVNAHNSTNLMTHASSMDTAVQETSSSSSISISSSSWWASVVAVSDCHSGICRL